MRALRTRLGPGLVTMNEVGAESLARAPLVGGVAAHDEGTEQSE